MSLSYVIRETMLMMGFTFLVGMVFAYIIKLLVFIFFDRKGVRELADQYRAVSRSNRMEMARIRKAVRLMDGSQDTSLLNYVLEDRNDDNRQKIKDLEKLAAFHYGDHGEQKGDEEMNSLYEFHGKVRP